jgi:hypothetical protein
MKITNLVVGIIVVALAALSLADGIVSYVDPTNQCFRLPMSKHSWLRALGTRSILHQSSK